MDSIESLLFSTTRISTHAGTQPLTAGTGFFFSRAERLYLVTGRHVFYEAAAAHFPDRISFRVHTHREDLTRTAEATMPLYRDAKALWTHASDGGGDIDVAVIEIAHGTVPAQARIEPFRPEDIFGDDETVRLGDPVLLPGFPLGFYDETHHLPVVRQGSIASAFGVRFQAKGCFLTDARMHRGSSGAPVVMRRDAVDERAASRPWILLGVHSARMDMSGRDAGQDDLLGLNLAWYADILMTLTSGDPPPEADAS